MPKTITCVIVNDTDIDMKPTLDGGRLNCQVRSVTSGAPPNTVAKKQTATFTMTGEPSGWVAYNLAGVLTVVGIYRNDPPGNRWSWGMWCNQYLHPTGAEAGASGQVEEAHAVLTDGKGKPLTAEEAARAESVTATYTIRIKPVAPVRGTVVAATPQSKAANTETFLPEWAQHLSLRRKRILVCAGRLSPQSANTGVTGAENPEYEQGGKYMSMASWWQYPPNASVTSCTGFNPKIIKAYFGAMDPNDPAPHGPEPDQWAFNAEGVTTWQASQYNQAYPDRTPVKPCPPQAGWTDAKKAPDALPQPGDTYLLKGQDGLTHHVGCIVYVPADPDDCWVTCDGGQADGQGYQVCELVWRVVLARSAEPPPRTRYVGGGQAERIPDMRSLYGWVDLDKYDDPGAGASDPKAYERALDKELADPDRGIVTRIERVRSWFKKKKNAEVESMRPSKDWQRIVGKQ